MNIDKVAKAAVAISKDASEVSFCTDQVTENINSVNDAVADTSIGTDQVKSQIINLSKISCCFKVQFISSRIKSYLLIHLNLILYHFNPFLGFNSPQLAAV